MAIDMKSAPISVRLLEPPIEPQDREQTLLFTELLAIGTTVPVVACEVAAVRHVLHAEEDIQRLTAHGERAIDRLPWPYSFEVSRFSTKSSTPSEYPSPALVSGNRISRTLNVSPMLASDTVGRSLATG